MAGRMKWRATRDALRAGMTMLALGALHAVAAPAIEDPTRPPPGLGAIASHAGGDDALVLESVLISDASRSAIISGKHVMLGGRIGSARLVKVNEGAVVLVIGGTQRRLELYPGVHKRSDARAVRE